MATRRLRTPRARATAQPATQDFRNQRLQFEYRDITDIQPYEWNARDNAKAVIAVKKSIENFGFLVPCVIDADGVLVAGHTRVEAAKELQMTAVPVVLASHLTPDQLNAFRLIDNKVSEIADWDYDLLAGEISKLSDVGFDMSGYGWTAEEIDCLKSVVSEDCLNASTLVSEQERTAISQAPRRAPGNTRCVIGEFVFFVPQRAYRTWSEGVRELCGFDEEAIAEELKRRLAILE